MWPKINLSVFFTQNNIPLLALQRFQITSRNRHLVLDHRNARVAIFLNFVLNVADSLNALIVLNWSGDVCINTTITINQIS